MKKIISVFAILIIAFQIYVFKELKEKDIHQISQVKEETDIIEIEKKERKVSKYIEGEKALYVDGILVVNKDYKLPDGYNPGVDKEALKAAQDMMKDANSEGLNLNITSGYRSYSVQEKLYKSYIRKDGQKNADRYSAKPGYSEHQTGLGFDFSNEDTKKTIGDWFNDTPEAKWLYENAYRYGFILRYPKGKEQITGYMNEPWHYRYIGIEHSVKFRMNDLTLEEYLDIENLDENNLNPNNLDIYNIAYIKE